MAETAKLKTRRPYAGRIPDLIVQEYVDVFRRVKPGALLANSENPALKLLGEMDVTKDGEMRMVIRKMGSTDPNIRPLLQTLESHSESPSGSGPLHERITKAEHFSESVVVKSPHNGGRYRANISSFLLPDNGKGKRKWNVNINIEDESLGSRIKETAEYIYRRVRYFGVSGLGNKRERVTAGDLAAQIQLVVDKDGNVHPRISEYYGTQTYMGLTITGPKHVEPIVRMLFK